MRETRLRLSGGNRRPLMRRRFEQDRDTVAPKLSINLHVSAVGSPFSTAY